MKGQIVSYRRGRHTQKPTHIIVEVDGVDNREAAIKLVGKETKWVSKGKEPKIIFGKVAAPHGNKGAIRLIFERGLPGQAVGDFLDF